MFTGLKKFYYRDEDITFEFEVDSHCFVDCYFALYLANYNKAANWLWKERADDGGHVTVPLKDIPR